MGRYLTTSLERQRAHDGTSWPLRLVSSGWTVPRQNVRLREARAGELDLTSRRPDVL